jgi:APA family basic amino acid/polyamine antiporter
VRPFPVPGRIAWVPVVPVLGIVSCLFLFLQLTVEVMAIGTVLVIIGGIAALFAGERADQERGAA